MWDINTITAEPSKYAQSRACLAPEPPHYLFGSIALRVLEIDPALYQATSTLLDQTTSASLQISQQIPNSSGSTQTYQSTMACSSSSNFSDSDPDCAWTPLSASTPRLRCENRDASTQTTQHRDASTQTDQQEPTVQVSTEPQISDQVQTISSSTVDPIALILLRILLLAMVLGIVLAIRSRIDVDGEGRDFGRISSG